jgi:3-methylfumaryl-CoA hydratase
MLGTEELQAWVGRTQWAEDVAAPGPLAGLASLLDHVAAPWTTNELPPLAHWLYFVPRERQSLLDGDGHPKRGDFLPPVELPRRMWVGSRVELKARIEIGAALRRRSTLMNVAAKTGRTGPMVFVKVKHEVTSDDTPAVIEEQDIVFRSAAIPGDIAAAAPGRRMTCAPHATRSLIPDPVLLFRFSALTFNAHRIHYDRDYARHAEGYPGLVVHGPLIATLLMDHFLRCFPASAVREFTFRAERPLFDSSPMELCVAQNDSGAELWANDSTGAVAMSATVRTR